MPCINVSKGELRQIAKRFPEEIERIADWEKKVAACAKQGFSTFKCSTNSPVELKGVGKRRLDRDIAAEGNIWKVVEWAKTTRGGKQYDLLADAEDATVCASAYGLCG